MAVFEGPIVHDSFQQRVPAQYPDAFEQNHVRPHDMTYVFRKNEVENSLSVFSVKQLIFQAKPWVWFLPYVFWSPWEIPRTGREDSPAGLVSDITRTPGTHRSLGRTYAPCTFSIASERKNIGSGTSNAPFLNYIVFCCKIISMLILYITISTQAHHMTF